MAKKTTTAKPATKPAKKPVKKPRGGGANPPPPTFIKILLPATTAVDPTSMTVVFRGPPGSTVTIFFGDAAGLPVAIPAPIGGGGFVSPATMDVATPLPVGTFYVADAVLSTPAGTTFSDTAIVKRV